MNIISSDTKRSISTGGTDTWVTLCSTMRYYLWDQRDKFSHAFGFIENNHVPNQDCLITAREFNLIRDAFSQIAPEKIIYDEKHPDKRPPWGDNISPTITSCANYLTSGNGDDLLAEIVKIFSYAAYAKVDIKLI